MYRLPSIILVLFGMLPILAQNPHGDELKIDCNQCHNPASWEIDQNYIRFDHSKTDFNLEGAHDKTDCKLCHTDLVLSNVPNQCASCHNDVHSMSVGNDCVQCHTSETWLVDNIPELHEANGFPLTGSHSGLSCVDCHFSETNLRFDRIGNDCISCHQDDYLATQSPNHSELGYSTDCLECHNPLGTGWDSENILHDFFPLTLGHDIDDCTQCHITDNYSDTSPECIACHQSDYNNTSDPNHIDAGFSTDCASCHTTNPGWTPADIDHDFFPLTLGHDNLDCTQCHITGNYSDASPECTACHQTDYDNTNDPNHTDAGFSTDCASCHTTNPGWTPAEIDHDFFPLTLGHDNLDCTQCHITGNYSDASPECLACHQDDYDNTNDPNHSAAQFPTDCVECHTTNPNWTPTTWDHDAQYFPIYSGDHQGEWDSCLECHINQNDYSVYSCFSCHEENETNDIHDHPDDPDFDGYVYESTACVLCHPNP